IKGGEIVYLQGYGWADKENFTAVTRNTMFRWASISKTVTAVSAMQLFEQGNLDLDKDILEYVPEFGDKGEAVTTRQILCHTGGLTHYSSNIVRTVRSYDVDHPYEDVVLALDNFKETPLIGKPGEKYSYSTHAFILLSAIVQKASGAKFADQVRHRIVEPTGMTTLQTDYQWIDIPNRTIGYRKDRQSGAIVRSTDTDVSWKLGGGGFISNIDDLARFAEAMIKSELVSKKTKEMIFTRQKTNDGKDVSYGLGFRLTGTGEDLQVSHSGSQEKTKTYMAFYPRKGTGVVVMCNSEHASPSRFVNLLFPVVNVSEDEAVGSR
ncbi:MAG: beta-lactamase family protein, partial [Planctomycetes bacterium]|nr:beta-lactamase family protein [Planctomycetota bacterium]